MNEGRFTGTNGISDTNFSRAHLDECVIANALSDTGLVPICRLVVADSTTIEKGRGPAAA